MIGLVIASVIAGAALGVALRAFQRVGRLEVAVADLRRELVLALPPPPPGDGPYRSTPLPPPTSIPGAGVVRSARIAAGVHEEASRVSTNGIPRPLGPKWGLG